MTGAPMASQFPVGEAARVRLGASTQTPAPILCALAADASATVRAAVAMNAGAPALADRTLTQDGDERVRALLARKLASLAPFLDQAERNQIQDHALSLLATLVEDEAVRVRAAITEIVKDMPRAPRTLILRLAADTAMPVAEPVIRLSPLLTQDDLLALLTTPPAPDTVKAIARRSRSRTRLPRRRTQRPSARCSPTRRPRYGKPPSTP
jgi:uncharacterized protein (DUF2336 family)